MLAGRPSKFSRPYSSDSLAIRSTPQRIVTREEILAAFDALNVWKRGEQRAPHQPLLVLLALGKWQQGQVEIPFEQANPVLTALLMAFGPVRKSYHPEFPFCHLQTDRVWLMRTVGTPKTRKGKSSYTRKELLKHHATGRFSDDILLALRRDPRWPARSPAES